MNEIPNNHGTTSLQTLLSRRSEGTLSSLAFCNNLKRKRSRKVLSRRTVIYSTERAIVSLQIHPLESRFLITGSTAGKCTIYDLSRHGAEAKKRQQETNWENFEDYLVHKPIAQTNPAVESAATTAIHDNEGIEAFTSSSFVGPVTCTKWYPADSGAFLSSHVSGSLSLWDTNAMVPVLQLAPFASDRQPLRGPQHQFESTRSAVLSTMDTTVHNPHLVAVASSDVPTIRLVDLRSGAAAHSFPGHRRAGVNTLAWSPMIAHVFASGGGDGTVRLFDIRKAGRHAWIGGDALDMDARRGTTTSRDPLIRHAYRPDYSHWKIHQKRTAASMTKTSRQLSMGPNNFSERKNIQSHQGSVTAISFTKDGHYLVSCGLDDDGVRLWDLQSQLVVPRQFQVPNRGRVARQYTRLLVQDDDLWISQGSELSQFNLHSGGSPRQRLLGHLKRIQALDACPDTGNLVTAGADGVILVWGSEVGRRDTLPNGRKRKALTVDKDNW